MSDTAGEFLAMDKARHTPGPWEWDEPGNWHGLSARVYHERAGAYEPVAQVQLSGWPKRVGIANAKLISLAPEMYELLSEAAVEIANLDSPDNPVAKRLRKLMGRMG